MLLDKQSQMNHKQISLSMKFYPLKKEIYQKLSFLCLLLCSPKITILYFLNKLDMSDVVSPIVVVAARVELPERLCPCGYISYKNRYECLRFCL